MLYYASWLAIIGLWDKNCHFDTYVLRKKSIGNHVQSLQIYTASWPKTFLQGVRPIAFYSLRCLNTYKKTPYQYVGLN